MDSTNERLQEELENPSADGHGRLYTPLSFLSKLSKPELLEKLWNLKGTEFEARLSEWLIRQGPNNTKSARLLPPLGRSLLLKIAGETAAEVALAYLDQAQGFWSRRPAFNIAVRTADDRLVTRLREVLAADESELGSNYRLSRHNALLALAALGDIEAVVQGVVALGLEVPRDLEWLLHEHDVDLDSLIPALDAVREGAATAPGAVLMLGLSRLSDMSATILGTLQSAERGSDLGLACIHALDAFGEESEEVERALARLKQLRKSNY